MTRFAPLDPYTTDEPAPRFDVDVPDDGYRWWYVDGISEDGQSGIVVIAFIGSVFSPYYYAARRRGAGNPFDHCAINVGLYRRRGGRWCMTERGEKSLSRGRDWLRVGPSSLSWDGSTLEIDIDERAAPFGQRVRGRIRIVPRSLVDQGLHLDTGKRHRWRPIAPSSDIDVAMQTPDVHWRGHGYFDTNSGARPLEDDFHGWSWSRRRRGEDSLITYSLRQRDGSRRASAIRVDESGTVQADALAPEIALKRGLWRVERSAHCDEPVLSIDDLEDTPFYTRSMLRGADQLTMHEYLDLDRFRSRWVRLLLPFRMPRIR